MNWLEKSYPNWILNNRWLVIFLCLILVIAAASGGRFTSFTTNYRIFFSADNPQLLAFEALENTYVKNDNVLFVLEPKNGKVFTREMLAVVDTLCHFRHLLLGHAFRVCTDHKPLVYFFGKSSFRFLGNLIHPTYS